MLKTGGLLNFYGKNSSCRTGLPEVLEALPVFLFRILLISFHWMPIYKQRVFVAVLQEVCRQIWVFAGFYGEYLI